MVPKIYIHDEEEEFVYAIPSEPTFVSKENRNGERKAWKVSVEIDVSSPNNVYKKKGWVLPLELRYEDEFPPSKKREHIVKIFKERFYPTGKRIGLKKYTEIKEAYDEKSGVNW